jgi:zinc resistance-associated protein
MLKTVAASAAALMIAVGAVAYAQQPPAKPDGGRGFAAEDRGPLLDARIAALHAGLRLTPEQEKAWPAFEQASRDLAALRARRLAGPGADESLDPVQRIQRRAEGLTARGAALKRYADALAPLYTSLDDGQKRRFGFLSRFERPRFHHFSFWRSRDRGEFGGRRGEFGGPGREFRDRRPMFGDTAGDDGRL